jgi:putative tryptophan/tyrosine transport system substrate-binding protein
MDRIGRRDFIVGAAALAGIPLTARAQTPGRVYRLAAWAIGRTPDEMGENGLSQYRAFYAELNRLGFVVGRNLTLDLYSTATSVSDYAPTAARIVQSRPDVIVPTSTAAARVLVGVGLPVPAVVPAVSDPISFGLTSGLARPDKNVTGFASDGGVDIYGLRLQLLKEAVPHARRIAVLSSEVRQTPAVTDMLRKAAATLGVELWVEAMSGTFDAANYESAFRSINSQQVQAMFVDGAIEHLANRARIIAFASSARLATIFHFREDVEAGGLLSYGVNLIDNYRKAAGYVARVLNGEKPADLPFQQPTKFDVVVNLKTAKLLGLTVPETIMIRATEVIE